MQLLEPTVSREEVARSGVADTQEVLSTSKSPEDSNRELLVREGNKSNEHLKINTLLYLPGNHRIRQDHAPQIQLLVGGKNWSNELRVVDILLYLPGNHRTIQDLATQIRGDHLDNMKLEHRRLESLRETRILLPLLRRKRHPRIKTTTLRQAGHDLIIKYLSLYHTLHQHLSSYMAPLWLKLP